MKKSFLILVALLVLLVALGGCQKKGGGALDRFDPNNPDTQPPQNPNPPNPANPEDQEPKTIGGKIRKCLNESNEGKIDNCLYELTESEKSIQPCEELILFPKDTCFKNVATKEKNIDYCTRIEDLDVKNDCYNEIGKSKNSIEICDMISGDRDTSDECYLDIGKGDACLKVRMGEERDNCLVGAARSERNVEFCPQVSNRKVDGDYLRDNCYTTSRVDQNGWICAELLDNELRADCFESADNFPAKEVDCFEFVNDYNSFNNCLYWKSTQTHDFNGCYKMTDNGRIDECVENAMEDIEDADLCEDIKFNDRVKRNECFKEAGINTLDVEICRRIEGQPWVKNSCFTEIAIEEENSGLCEEIRVQDATDRDLCYQRVAVATQEFPVCENIENDSRYFMCYGEVGLSFGASEICEKAERDELAILPYSARIQCYNYYAVEARDKKVCNNIDASASIEEQCLDGVEDALICEDDDGVCDKDNCNFLNDNDCVSPDYCTRDTDCNDYRSATDDYCDTKEKKCVYDYISECIDGDGFCPVDCTWKRSDYGLSSSIQNQDNNCRPDCSELGGQAYNIGNIYNGEEVDEDFECPGGTENVDDTKQDFCCVSE